MIRIIQPHQLKSDPTGSLKLGDYIGGGWLRLFQGASDYSQPGRRTKQLEARALMRGLGICSD